jgi:hypothetical protein
MLEVISLGAGVQSSVMALMAARGELSPAPNCAIFSDTQWEPKAIYEHLEWLESVVSNPLEVENPFPIYWVTNGSLRDDAIAHQPVRGRGTKKFSAVPWFTEKGMGRRQCTFDYKIVPLNKRIRKLLGYKPRQRIPLESARVWVGISTDEAMRMKPSRERWIQNAWPLIDANMSRQDCLVWFEKNYPDRQLQKSSCLGCPFHSDARWRDIKNGDPDEWADVVEVDRAIRDGGKNNQPQFMHRSLKPIDQADLRTLEDMGQINMFNEECEGMCGV